MTSAPAGGRIYLNGKETGRVTPATVAMDLGGVAKREVELGVRQAGRKDEIRRVVVGAGPAVEVALTLTASEPVVGQITQVELGGVQVPFAAIPAAEFLMGTDASEVDRIWQRFGWPDGWKQWASDEAPMHRVEVDGFQMGVTEVTVGQFRAYGRATGKALPQQEACAFPQDHCPHGPAAVDLRAACLPPLRRTSQQGWTRLSPRTPAKLDRGVMERGLR